MQDSLIDKEEFKKVDYEGIIVRPPSEAYSLLLTGRCRQKEARVFTWFLILREIDLT